MCLFTDLDMCSQGHECQHVCVKSGESYHCICQKGYVLNEDKKTCSRKQNKQQIASLSWPENADLMINLRTSAVKVLSFP